jgi:hypothetical protein
MDGAVASISSDAFIIIARYAPLSDREASVVFA